MANSPFFSVVIPLFNKGKYVHETIDSVLAQTFNDFEVVIIDDGSTDGSLDVVASFDDPRIRLIQKKNGGVSSARNRGIKESRGQHIAFLDADDLWFPKHLENAYNFYNEYPNVNWYAGNWIRNKNIPKIKSNIKNIFKIRNYFSEGFKQVCSSSLVIKRSFMEPILFNEKYCKGEDLLCWFLLGCKDSLIGLGTEITSFYRMSDNSTTKQIEKNFAFDWDYVFECIETAKKIDDNLLNSNVMQFFISRLLHSYFKDHNCIEIHLFMKKHQNIISIKNRIIFTFMRMRIFPYAFRKIIFRILLRLYVL